MVKMQPYTREDFFKSIPNLGNKCLLDLGCGSQRPFSMAYLTYLYKQSETLEEGGKFERRIVAVDSQYDSLTVLRTGASICADARNLPFVDKTFDIVAAGSLFHRLRDYGLEIAVAESVRVLNPNGYLIGDIPLSPNELGEVSLDVYLEQVRYYKKVMNERGLTFLMEGIGFNEDIIVTCPAFYFSTRKNR